MPCCRARVAESRASAMPAKSEKSKRDSGLIRKPRKHCNALDGKQWLKNSISVWSDIHKTTEEMRLKHPAMFPMMLVERLIETFFPLDGELVLDPFAGSGSTPLAAVRLGKRAVGLELSPDYVTLANERIASSSRKPIESGDRPTRTDAIVHNASATDLLSFVEPSSVDLCITSPPYWNILNQRRTADGRGVRHYGNRDGDIGTIDDYHEFLDVLTAVFRDVLTTLKPGAFCCVNVMDLRKKNQFFPLHSDLAARLAKVGFIYDDLIIWDRKPEYNNLRPLGYPSVFRINKVHEFVLLMQKPRQP